MKKKRNRRPEEFKLEAVRLVLTRGDRTIADIAKSLGVGESVLQRWRKKYEPALAGKVKGAARSTSPDAAESAELRELRKRVRELEMERDILKKAAAFFAKESS